MKTTRSDDILFCFFLLFVACIAITTYASLSEKDKQILKEKFEDYKKEKTTNIKMI
jgi:TRAP-type C4-dicarboxylate transport system substrate-binding protein